jgi:hypothetical protein
MLLPQLLSFQTLALLPGGGGRDRIFHFHLSISVPAKSFRMRTYEQTPCFAWFWPKSSVRNFFRIRTYTDRICKPFRMRTYEKRGRGVRLPSRGMLTLAAGERPQRAGDSHGAQAVVVRQVKQPGSKSKRSMVCCSKVIWQRSRTKARMRGRGSQIIGGNGAGFCACRRRGFALRRRTLGRY